MKTQKKEEEEEEDEEESVHCTSQAATQVGWFKQVRGCDYDKVEISRNSIQFQFGLDYFINL